MELTKKILESLKYQLHQSEKFSTSLPAFSMKDMATIVIDMAEYILQFSDDEQEILKFEDVQTICREVPPEFVTVKQFERDFGVASGDKVADICFREFEHMKDFAIKKHKWFVHPIKFMEFMQTNSKYPRIQYRCRKFLNKNSKSPFLPKEWGQLC